MPFCLDRNILDIIKYLENSPTARAKSYGEDECVDHIIKDYQNRKPISSSYLTFHFPNKNPINKCLPSPILSICQSHSSSYSSLKKFQMEI
jgi:hypothetical protein